MRNIYLIQRCHIQKGYDENDDLYTTIKRDYMGAAHLVKSGYLYDTRLIKRNYYSLNGFYYEPLGRKIHELPYLVNENMNEIESLKLLFYRR